jgi:hypothetical protein
MNCGRPKFAAPSMMQSIRDGVVSQLAQASCLIGSTRSPTQELSIW